MRAFSRFMFVLVVLFNLVFSNIIVTAVALDDDYGTQYNVSYYQIPYGNGLDDDGDGVVDNFGEPDVVYGEVNITKSDRVVESWSDSFAYPSPRDYGVEIGGPYESLYEVSINAVDPGSSVSPLYPCYVVSSVNSSLNYTVKTNTINMVSFYMNLDPTGLMNGASEIWYRSAIVWDSTLFKNYYLNIIDDSGNLVYASTDGNIVSTPSPYVVKDNSGYERIYQKMNIDFRTNTRYIFKEYIETNDDIPINKFKCFFLDFTDLGNDNETDTYVFQGSPYSNKIARECSWSMVPIIGIGASGIEIPIWSETAFNNTFYPEILTSKIIGGSGTLNVTHASFIVPCRVSSLTNVTIFAKTWSGGLESPWVQGITFDTAGTLIFTTPISDPDNASSNVYQLKIRINNLNATNAGDVFLFRVYPTAGAICGVNYNGSYLDVYNFAFHFELTNETRIVPSSSSPNYQMIAGGVLLVALGLIIIGFTWWSGIGEGVGITVISSGLAMTTAEVLAYTALGGILVIVGTSAVIYGLNPSGTGIAQNLIRAILAFVEGLIALGKAVWNVILQVIEAIKWFINAIMTWGGDILWAIAEIIYFVAFVIVLSLWGVFLSTMRYVAVGDAEGAWAALTKPFMKSYKWVKKRPVYKEGKKLALAAATKGASTIGNKMR